MSRLERLCPRVRSSAPRPSYDSTSLSSVDTSTLSTTSSSTDLWNVRAMPDVPFSRLSKPLSLRAGARQRPSHLDRFSSITLIWLYVHGSFINNSVLSVLLTVKWILHFSSAFSPVFSPYSITDRKNNSSHDHYWQKSEFWQKPFFPAWQTSCWWKSLPTLPARSWWAWLGEHHQSRNTNTNTKTPTNTNTMYKTLLTSPCYQ